MDSVVQALSEAYDALVAAAAGVVEARTAAEGQRTSATDAALEEFKHRWELFAAACDEADELVGSARVRLEFERVADEEDRADPGAVAAFSWAGLDHAIADMKRSSEMDDA